MKVLRLCVLMMSLTTMMTSFSLKASSHDHHGSLVKNQSSCECEQCDCNNCEEENCDCKDCDCVE